MSAIKPPAPTTDLLRLDPRMRLAQTRAELGLLQGDVLEVRDEMAVLRTLLENAMASIDWLLEDRARLTTALQTIGAVVTTVAVPAPLPVAELVEDEAAAAPAVPDSA